MFAGGGGAGRGRHHAGMVHRVALEGPDVDAVVDHVPAAAGFAGVLAHQGAGHGEGVVLADQAHGVGIPAFAHQRHIAGDIHTGRAQGPHKAPAGSGAAGSGHW